MRLTEHRCQCAKCGHYFSRTSTFDKHRAGSFAAPGEWAGSRRCLSADEMQAKGLAQNADGVWVTAASDWRAA